MGGWIVGGGGGGGGLSCGPEPATRSDQPRRPDARGPRAGAAGGPKARRAGPGARSVRFGAAGRACCPGLALAPSVDALPVARSPAARPALRQRRRPVPFPPFPPPPSACRAQPRRRGLRTECIGREGGGGGEDAVHGGGGRGGGRRATGKARRADSEAPVLVRRRVVGALHADAQQAGQARGGDAGPPRHLGRGRGRGGGRESVNLWMRKRQSWSVKASSIESIKGRAAATPPRRGRAGPVGPGRGRPPRPGTPCRGMRRGRRRRWGR